MPPKKTNQGPPAANTPGPAAAGSYLLRDAGPEQAVRSEEQDQNQDGEDDRLAPLFPGVLPPELSDQSDDDSAEYRPRDVPDAAQDGGGEGVQPVLEPHLIADRV